MASTITMYAVNAAVIRQLKANGKTEDIRLTKQDFKKIMFKEMVCSSLSTVNSKWLAFGYQPGMRMNPEETTVFIKDLNDLIKLADEYEPR